ncbi:MAG TPA: methylated-DNA--[protein]-cysteine S-methyltransferase [Dehalococcoidia bacterium]|nr:methylated-DNA--[protein]-cysteine S-methyltransferase [Dehalococcoidia bacterium]
MPDRPVVRYGSLAAPFGKIFVGVSDGKVVRVSLRQSEHAFSEALLRDGYKPVRDPSALAPVLERFEEYFRGERKSVDVEVDLSRLSPFNRAVLEETRRVPAGSVVSYAEIARRIGKPRAYRAVGNALASNPAPVAVPCHRVVSTGGRMGGYTGGLDIKLHLLALEGFASPAKKARKKPVRSRAR